MRIPNYLKEAIENYDSATCSGFETYAYQPVSKFESDGTISLDQVRCPASPPHFFIETHTCPIFLPHGDPHP